MKIFACFAGVGVLMVIAFPPFVHAQSPQRSEWHGLTRIDELFCAGEACTGELTTCVEGSIRITNLHKTSYLEGVCDDGDPAVPDCAGRLTDFIEFCRPLDRSVTIGTMSASSFRGKGRTCFDPTATSDCSGTLPDGVAVVVEYGIRVRTRSAVKPSASGETLQFPSHGTVKAVPTAVESFTIDDKTVELRGTINSSYTSQFDSGFDNCAAENALLDPPQPPGCGIVGVNLTEPTTGCCADCNGDGEVRVDELVTGVNNALEGCTE